MTATNSNGVGGKRSWLIWAAILIAMIIGGILIPEGASPYDLKSNGSDGYLGVRRILESYDAKIESLDASEVGSALIDQFDVVFVPRARQMSDGDVSNFEEYALAGGRLVLAGPVEGLGASGSSDDSEEVDPDDPFGVGPMVDATEPGYCTDSGFEEAGTLSLSYYEPTYSLDGSEFLSCFGDEFDALVVGQSYDLGEVINVGGPELFTNASMGAPEPDTQVGDIPGNVVLLIRALGVDRPGLRVGIVESGLDAIPTTGQRDLFDFMSDGVKMGLWQMVIAGLFYFWFRSRRLRRLLPEVQPVTVQSSSFVDAVGGLLHRQSNPATAAASVRSATQRELCALVHLPRNASPQVLSSVLAQRTGRDPEQIFYLLTAPVQSDAELLTCTTELDHLREDLRSD